MDISKFKHFAISERIVEYLQHKTRNNDAHFFRILVSYQLAKTASMMWCKFNIPGRGEIPVNMYALNLAVSGYGKGFSNNIMEERVLKEFREEFQEHTYEELAEQNLAKLAVERALRKESDEDKELIKVEKEFDALGPMLFSFDSGTLPALKQMRHRVLMAGCGSLNLEIDEIGSNLMGNTEVLNGYLELFDVGRIKQKLTKNTSENGRNEEIEGRTPTNLMLYGTPVKLLDSSRTEQEFWSFISSGYGRRCFYCYSPDRGKIRRQSAKDMLLASKDTSTDSYLEDLSQHMRSLAYPDNFDLTLEMSDDVALILFNYQIWCEERADEYNVYDEILQTEMSHRYFKAAKVAATYAFVEGELEVTQEHMEAAIKLAEESGEHFHKMVHRDPDYVNLAKYIADSDAEHTHPDLVKALPFFKGSTSQRKEMLDMAISWGYKNSLVISKSYIDGIEFISGEALQETDLSQLAIAVSDHIADKYENKFVGWEELEDLSMVNDMHWINHHLVKGDEGKGHRHTDNVMPGFNLLVLDVDDGTTIEDALDLMDGYKMCLYTTKRHTASAHRFRLIIPFTHCLFMDEAEYKEFMHNIFDWLPFTVDDKTGQRSRKWLTCDIDSQPDGAFEFVEGKLLDVLPFIPRTSRNDEQQKIIAQYGDLDNLERWFVLNTGMGNRNERLLRFALMLVDRGYDYNTIAEKLFLLNDKIANSLPRDELRNTILKTVRSKTTTQ